MLQLLRSCRIRFNMSGIRFSFEKAGMVDVTIKVQKAGAMSGMNMN